MLHVNSSVNPPRSLGIPSACVIAAASAAAFLVLSHFRFVRTGKRRPRAEPDFLESARCRALVLPRSNSHNNFIKLF